MSKLRVKVFRDCCLGDNGLVLQGIYSETLLLNDGRHEEVFALKDFSRFQEIFASIRLVCFNLLWKFFLLFDGTLNLVNQLCLFWIHKALFLI